MALEAYNDRITIVDAQTGEDKVVQEMSRIVCKAPVSRGPRPLPRVVVLSPEGAFSPEFTRNLAFRFGCVYVQAGDWEPKKDEFELVERHGKGFLPHQET